MIIIYILITILVIILSTILKRKNIKLFNLLTSIITATLSFIAIVAFWVFIYRGGVYDNWYPMVGHFISAHFGFIGIVLWQYLENKKITFNKWINSIFKK